MGAIWPDSVAIHASSPGESSPSAIPKMRTLSPSSRRAPLSSSPHPSAAPLPRQAVGAPAGAGVPRATAGSPPKIPGRISSLPLQPSSSRQPTAIAIDDRAESRRHLAFGITRARDSRLATAAFAVEPCLIWMSPTYPTFAAAFSAVWIHTRAVANSAPASLGCFLGGQGQRRIP